MFRGTRKAPPPLILDGYQPGEFIRWFKRHQPDVLVSVDRFGLRLANELQLRIPDDIGYASLDIDGELPDYPDMSGIDQNSQLVGAAAMDMLAVAMQKKQRGVPLHPMRMEVEGEWKAGSSTRQINAS
jgi:DNA-binding LacI/PurR family transcriptional regulator